MKKDYQYPNFRQIRAGVIVPIYVNYKEQKDLEGYARLNHQVSGTLPSKPYIRAEIGTIGDDREPHSVIWSWRRYNVTFVDPKEFDKNISPEDRMKYLHMKDFKTERNVAFYLTVSSVLQS